MDRILPRLIFWSLTIWVVGYTVILGLALILQFALHELPCPLCMLQRYAMILCTLGALWILREAQHGTLTLSGYAQGLGLGALGACFGVLFSVRQVLLHILPGDPGYGAPILGLHLYSWALVSFCVVILFTAVLAILAPVAVPEAPAGKGGAALIPRLCGLAFLAIVAANAVMIVFLEGFAWVLPDNPTSYGLFG